MPSSQRGESLGVTVRRSVPSTIAEFVVTGCQLKDPFRSWRRTERVLHRDLICEDSTSVMHILLLLSQLPWKGSRGPGRLCGGELRW
jgi:hypothetical protein